MYNGAMDNMIERVFSRELADRLARDEGYDLKCGYGDLFELYVAAIYSLSNRSVIWVVGENENFKEKGERLGLWLDFLGCRQGGIGFYKRPFEDPYVNNSGDFNTVGRKLELLSLLQEKERCLIVTTLSALSIRVEDKARFKAFFLPVGVGRTMNRDDFIQKAILMGYVSRDEVEDRGDLAWRGSIVDLFPPNREKPVRLEFEGAKIISLRVFDPETQVSLENIESIILPISRFFLDHETPDDYLANAAGNMKFLPEIVEGSRMVISGLRQIEEEYHKLMESYRKIYKITARTKGGTQKKNLKKVGDIFDFPLDRYRQGIINLDETFDGISGEGEITRFKGDARELNYQDIQRIREKIEKKNYRLFVFPGSREAEASLRQYFGAPHFTAADIPLSFENTRTRSLFLAYRSYRFLEEFRHLERPKKEKRDRFIKDIKINDYVVHRKHGIGQFMGFTRLEFSGFDRLEPARYSTEFLKIAYLDNEFLYVPVLELPDLARYTAFEGYSPKIDKLGGKSWQLKQKRAKKNMVNFARELLELYAVRKSIPGRSYPGDYELENQLQQDFQYVETEDQKRVIKEVLDDLEAEHPMDRLICGDVSFGKTEVAIRAAFRVVSTGKQVAFLCPTTILALQHYNTFKERLARFPVSIALLSRMVPRKEQLPVYEGLREGKVDIVVGTHTLISKEITFKDLGLYIIDEEQRFGVFQKERLKKNREDIDGLSLTATPIPRTLSFSLAGLQDISIIRTPPIGRLAVKNYVGYFSQEIVMSAILNEIERDGLVYIIYNNIEKIYSFKDKLQALLPEVSFAVIHADMRVEAIEKNLLAFIARKARVLVSTTIIENGIDIPAVNTLIVMHADRFGLTQLYQLRGRIGRSNRQAYAYFLVPSMNISDKAKSRLQAIREFADLGSGYRLAEFDLKLRGAGSLLGNKQHGHIEALGFDYYLELLNKTIRELKGQEEGRREVKININFPYSIDTDYIKDTPERIAFYKRVIDAEDFSQLEQTRRDLEDRYGKLHQSIEKIFFAAAVRIVAGRFRFQEVDVFLDKIVIKWAIDEPGSRDACSQLLQNFPGEMTAEDSCELRFRHFKQFLEAFTQESRGQGPPTGDGGLGKIASETL